MTPNSSKLFQIATYMYSFRECMLCSHKNGVFRVEIAQGDSRKTMTVKPCLVKGKLNRVTLPYSKADYYLLCTDEGDYLLSNKYVMRQKITDKNKLVPLGTGDRNTMCDDIRKRLEKSPLGSCATVREWKPRKR
jgi:hypothetical protein